MEEVEKLQEAENKLTLQVQEATRRENVLNMRLATKQQELQDTLVSNSRYCLNCHMLNSICCFYVLVQLSTG